MDVMTWEEEISRLFTCISEWFEIVTDDASGCATHVHIGKASAPEFDLDEIRKLSRGVFLFQDSISVEEPFDEYSRIVPLPLSHFSNVQNYSREEVLAAMNPPMPPTNLGSEAEWDPKFVALNFLSLNTLGTIEYRQGKYSRTAHDACQWVTLALAAVHVFLENDLDVAHAEVGQGVLSMPHTAVDHILHRGAYALGYLHVRVYLWSLCQEFLAARGLPNRPRTWPRQI
ncbi:hypothetical protein MY11210_007950 [Beauveria gryllotalpidicola]